MNDQGAYEQSWEEPVTEVLHPTEILILAALRWLDLPISATAMVQISGGAITLASFDYHLKRLENLEILEVVETTLRRKAWPSEKVFDIRLARAG